MFQISASETFEDGQVIFEEGSYGDWIYVIEHGAVELSRMAGDLPMVIDVLLPGDVFGEVAYISKHNRCVTAMARGVTELSVVDRSFLDEEFNRLSGSSRHILNSLALGYQRLVDQLAHEKLRREEPRVAKMFSLNFRDRKSLINAYSENVSGVGMFILTANPLARGERFRLKLQLPDGGEPMKIGCEVAWCRKSTDDGVRRPVGMGVRFVQITQEHLVRLRAAIHAPERHA